MNLATWKIVLAVKAILVDAETVAGSRVYVNRFRKIWEGQVPAISVHAIEEEDAIRDSSPRTYDRELRLAVISFVRPDPIAAGNPPREVAADEILALIGDEIEEAIAFDQHLRGTCSDCFISSSHVEPINFGEEAFAAQQQVFTVQYSTEAGERGDPRALYDFLRLHLEYGGTPEKPAVEDDVELPPVVP